MIITGIVEKGAGIGQSEFVPTINLLLNEVRVGLEFGIYACSVKVFNETYNGVMHYGIRSTIDNLITCEINIFDFNSYIYGVEVEVKVKDKIRDIVKFENREDLKAQILKDIVKAKELLL
jgi:riboflavin kinase/FMN adenylyltransferase